MASAHVCDSKRRYETRKDAAAEAARQRCESREPFYAYHCRHHHCWHTGHPPGWRAEHPDATPMPLGTKDFHRTDGKERLRRERTLIRRAQRSEEE